MNLPTRSTLIFCIALLLVNTYMQHRMLSSRATALTETKVTLAAAVNQLSTEMPTQLDVNGNLWKIREITSPGNSTVTLAYTSCDTRTIEVKRGGDYNQQPEVLLHELMHAMVCQTPGAVPAVVNLYYNSASNENHEGIYVTSRLITSLLKRNPQLASFLARPDLKR